MGAFNLRKYAIIVYTKCSTNEELTFKRALDIAHLNHNSISVNIILITFKFETMSLSPVKKLYF